MNNSLKLLAVLCIGLCASPSFANNECSSLFSDRARVVPNENPIVLTADIRRAVAAHELDIFDKRLKKIEEENGGALTTAALAKYYESQFFPDVLIQRRLEMAEHIDAENIFAILGDLSYPETMRLFIGDQPDVVLPDSLVGRYLTETGAKLQKRSYTELPPSQRTGPERLLVPVDAATFPIYKKYFSNQLAYSMQGHSNIILGAEMEYPNGGAAPKALGFLTANTPLPMVLLKTTEGQRMIRYIRAAYTAPGWAGRNPWAIPAIGGGQYVDKAGRYACCGHYQGNIPIGDKLVTEIVLPGAGPNNTDVPIVAHVRQPDFSNPQQKAWEKVWTYPMHEPVSAVLGLAHNNGVGEFASAGWGIQTLLVSAPIERVPFVFLFVEDAKAIIDPNLPLHFEQPR